MLNRINKFINLKTGMRYWYVVRFTYKDKKTTQRIFDFTGEIGFADRADILIYRVPNKTNTPFHFNKQLRPHLRNGILSREIICYLGRFKRKPAPTQP